MTVSAVTIGSTTGAVLGVGAGQLGDPRDGVMAAANGLAFTGAPHLALEGFVGALLAMTGALLIGLARRHRRPLDPAFVTATADTAAPGDPPRS